MRRSDRSHPLLRRVLIPTALLMLLGAWPRAGIAAPEGEMRWAVHISLAPTYFEPAETPGIITPFMVLYALHDALVKPMPGQPLAPSLAESWSASSDGITYEFVLRRGARFHNGDLLTADDVKYSFERYRGAGQKLLKERVKEVQVVDPGRVRFVLRAPWPDFMTFYGSPATGAGWIVPRKYVERVGDEGFKKAPVGAGPYRFVAFTPGVELTLEAFEGYWRKVPAIKRLVFKVVPDEATRLAALKRGEVDVAYSVRGALADEMRRTPGLTVKPALGQFTYWYSFVDQWDPKSPWADRRVRLAANLALDRKAINEAETLGYSRVTGSIIPQDFEYAWKAPAFAYDPGQARKLLAEAGYPNGFDAGAVSSDIVYSGFAEAVGNFWRTVGIRAQMAPKERAAYTKEYQEKKLRGVLGTGSAAAGNAATRLETFVAAGGAWVYGSYPDIDGLFQEQAREGDRKRREVLLHRIQQLMHEKVVHAPLMEPAFINGIGPRVAESGLGLIAGYNYSAPFEDLRLAIR
jgi:peptide/nickel transport system substrate-binding protein